MVLVVLILILVLVLIVLLILILILILILVLVVVSAAAVLLLIFEHLLGVGQIGLGLHVAGVAPQRVLVRIDRRLPGALTGSGVAHIVESVGRVRPFGERVDARLVVAVRFLIVLHPVVGVAQIVSTGQGSGVCHQGLLVIDLGLLPAFLPEIAVAVAHAFAFALREAGRRTQQQGQRDTDDSFHVNL